MLRDQCTLSDGQQPLLSIIIPTCNRPQYLRVAVNTIARACPNAEVIVCDNSDSNGLKEELAEFIARGFVRYQFLPTKLSVVDNFESARKLACGRYLMFIGDDDCVGPRLEDIARWADENAVDAVVSYHNKFLANYFWPGVKSKYFKGKYSAALFIGAFSGKSKRIDNRKAIAAAAANPGSGLGCMPRAYHGLVSKDLIDRIVQRWGSLFGGVSPDIYSATLISAESTNAWLIDYPFILPGASPVSTAGQGAARIDKGALNSTDHIRRFGPDLRWDDRIPKFYSPLTVWSYSMQCALERVGPAVAILNFPKLYLSCLIHHPEFREETLYALSLWRKEHGNIPLLAGMLQGLESEFLFQYRRVSRRLFTPDQAVHRLEDIGQAFDALCRHVSRTAPELVRVPHAR